MTDNSMFVAEEVAQGYNGSLFNIITETSVKCIYTNADQLRNKLNELDILITQETQISSLLLKYCLNQPQKFRVHQFYSVLMGMTLTLAKMVGEV